MAASVIASDEHSGAAEQGPAAGSSVPEYDGELNTFHHAFPTELEAAVRRLPWTSNARVLDVPCGDGFYTCLLAQQLGPGGQIYAADLLPAYLERARDRAREASLQPPPQFVRANIYELPFSPESFDGVFCAQSLISIDDPLRALQEIRRVLKPGGWLAILEDDEFHHVVLPWPASLEVALQAAILQSSLKTYGSAGKLFVGRRIRRQLRSVGFAAVSRSTYAADRHAPFKLPEQRFLALYLERLRRRALPHLTRVARRTFDRLTVPGSPQYLLRADDLDMTCLFALWVARRPAAGP